MHPISLKRSCLEKKRKGRKEYQKAAFVRKMVCGGTRGRERGRKEGRNIPYYVS